LTVPRSGDRGAPVARDSAASVEAHTLLDSQEISVPIHDGAAYRGIDA
jgi:hypothetical protein